MGEEMSCSSTLEQKLIDAPLLTVYKPPAYVANV